MKVTGIIAEYNPLHLGHAYHLRKAREMTGADFCVVVMSGSFTQRGEPALLDKYLRAEMALLQGADLVLELPVCYASASAPYFAQGSISLLEQLGVVNALVFGSESEDLSSLLRIAQLLVKEPPVYTASLKAALRQGLSFPAARSRALAAALAPAPMSELSSNDLLGLEYCKSLFSLHSSIQPIPLLRQGSDYLAKELPPAPDPRMCKEAASDTQPKHEEIKKAGSYSSALALRTALRQGASPTALRPHVPPSVYAILEREYQKTFPIFPDTLSAMLHYRLLTETDDGFTEYSDVSRELSDRIRNRLSDYQSFSSFCELLKTKEMTYTRISRSLLHIFLSLKEEEISSFLSQGTVFYARILGFRQSATPLLTAIKANGSIPLLSKPADAAQYLSPPGIRQLAMDLSASHLYNALIWHTYGRALPMEQRRQILKL